MLLEEKVVGFNKNRVLRETQVSEQLHPRIQKRRHSDLLLHINYRCSNGITQELVGTYLDYVFIILECLILSQDLMHLTIDVETESVEC